MVTGMRCRHCNVDIADDSTAVQHGDDIFCCPNCANYMEHSTGGSDPHPAGDPARDLTCAHCGVPIVHEATMQTRGDQAFCCANCARGHQG